MALQLVARSSPRLLAAVLVLQVAVAAAAVAQVGLAALLVQALVAPAPSSHRLGLLLAALAALAAASAVIGVLSARVQRVLAEVVSRAVWADVLTVASQVPLTAYDTAEFSERMSRVKEHAVGRPLSVVFATSTLVSGTLGSAGFVAYLGSVHWSMPLLVLLAGLPAVIGAQAAARREHRFVHGATTIFRRRLYTADLLAGRDAAKELRAYGFGGWLRRQHDALHREFTDRLVRHAREQGALLAVTGALSAVMGVAALAVLVLLVGAGTVAVGAAAGAALALRLLSGRIQELVTGIGQIYESSLFLEDLRSLPEVDPAQDPGGLALEALVHDRLEQLDLRGVSFTYPGAERASLVDVDLVLRRGGVTALVGENGSGKTTLAKIASALYAPDGGAVRWNGRPVSTERDREAARRRIAVLFQDFGRYAFTAHENVAIGDVEALDDAARRDVAARRAGADEVVSRLRDGWETMMAAEFGGQDASLGQWQRLALARATFRDADLVILDEPTAALDPRAEARLFEDVRRTLADRAVLLITHRLASARTADEIVVLRHGAVVERGRHDDLMARGGVYAELWDLQASGYAVDDGAPGPG